MRLIQSHGLEECQGSRHCFPGRMWQKVAWLLEIAVVAAPSRFYQRLPQWPSFTMQFAEAFLEAGLEFFFSFPSDSVLALPLVNPFLL